MEKIVCFFLIHSIAMSDAGSDQEDFEASNNAGKKKRPTRDDEIEQAEKKPKTEAPTQEEAEEKGDGEDDAPNEGPTRGEVPVVDYTPPDTVLDNAPKSKQIYAKTLNVKDICNILGGCCAIPNIAEVIMTFKPTGLELYARPATSPVIVNAFYSNSKENFREYKVETTVEHTISKAELEDLKKKVGKDVEFLEFQNNAEGFKIGGRRVYKTGGSCDFTVQLTSISPQTKVVDMSSLVWNLQICTASQQFFDNVSFFDESIEFIKLTLQSKSLVFKGFRDTGSATKSVIQPIQSEVTGGYDALFNKKMLKAVTSARDINRALCISFKLDDQTCMPVHFKYEMGKEAIQSHFSVYVAPMGGEERE